MIFETIRQLQNSTGDPRHNLGYLPLRWNRATAERFPVPLDGARVAELVAFVRDNKGPVEAEIEAFQRYRDQYPVEMARRSFLLALVSPRIRFHDALSVTQGLVTLPATDEEIKQALIVRRTRGASLVNQWRQKMAYYQASRDWLRSLTPDALDTEFTYEALLQRPGMGPKTAAFAVALFDPWGHVFTLDQWMLRLTVALHGQHPRYHIKPDVSGYRVTQQAWLDWCRAVVPGIAPFVVQWTLWNGCFGEHISHLGLIGG